MADCDRCNGSGVTGPELGFCPECCGQGELSASSALRPGDRVDLVRYGYIVKVEILERAAIRCDYGGDCPGHASPEDRPCGYVNPEFARGMRRAVEIASQIYAMRRVVRIDELKEAVEKELKS